MYARKMFFVLLLVGMAGILTAANAGDYKTAGNSAAFTAAPWYTCTHVADDGEETWVSSSYPPDGFEGTIHLNGNITMNIDYTLKGNIKAADDAKFELGKTSGGEIYVDFVLDGGNFEYYEIVINKGSKLVNKGTIEDKAITQGKKPGDITLATGEGNEFGGTGNLFSTLENHGSIQISNSVALLKFLDYSLFISKEGATIEGAANCSTNTHTTFHIANIDGLTEANQLTGNHGCQDNGVNLVYNGTQRQKSGNPLPTMLRNVVFDNPYGVELETDFTVFTNDGSVRVTSGSTLDVGPYIISTSNKNWGNAKFYLEDNATIITQNPNGLSSKKTGAYISSGSIQLNDAEYSSGGNYTYNGTGVQNTGCFDTTPIAHTVNNLTADDSNGLTDLVFCIDGINITGTATGKDFFVGNYTLPVTLANLHLQQTPMGYPQLNWVTASETNCMGFYVWRAQDQDLAAAMRVSSLIEAVNTSQGAAYSWTDLELFEDGSYYYWLEDISYDQETAFHGPRMITISFYGSQEAPEIIQTTGLKKAYPNPFNPRVWINYYLAENTALLSVDFYNLKGQKVDSIQLSNQAKGAHTLSWDADRLNLDSGIYFVRLSAANSSSTLKIVLSK